MPISHYAEEDHNRSQFIKHLRACLLCNGIFILIHVLLGIWLHSHSMSLGNFLGSFVVFLSPFLWILGSLFLQELAKWEAYFLIGIVWLLTLSQIGFLVYTLMQPFMGMFTQTYGLALQHGVTLSSMLLVIIANMVRRFALNKDED